jgi:hypothetical protein
MNISRLGRTFSKKNSFSCSAIDEFVQSLCRWITSHKADLNEASVRLTISPPGRFRYSPKFGVSGKTSQGKSPGDLRLQQTCSLAWLGEEELPRWVKAHTQRCAPNQLVGISGIWSNGCPRTQTSSVPFQPSKVLAGCPISAGCACA